MSIHFRDTYEMSDTSGYRVQGGCLCGAVRFELRQPPADAGYCHCTRCQRRTGTAASANASIDASSFHLLTGEESVGGWQPPSGMEKCFCRECGAHLFSRNADRSRMAIRLSAFDEDPGVSLSYRQYVAYAASWEPIPDDGLPRYPESRQR